MEVIDAIRKRYSDESIFLLGDFPSRAVDAISTGSYSLNAALGIGGVPVGRVTEIFGEDGSGKTTLCQHVVAGAQEKGMLAAYIDVENSLDIGYAAACGVDVDAMYFSQPNFAEEALGVADALVASGEFGLVVIDSIAALSPKSENEEEEFVDINTTGMRRAKLLNVFFRRAMPKMRKNNATVLLTNQLRDNTRSMFGGTIQPGGRALKHYASVRIQIKRKYQGEIKTSGNIIGHTIEATIIKNKVASPYQIAELPLLYGYGIDKEADLLITAIELGVVKKARSYFRYEGETIAQGFVNTVQALKDNVELSETIEKELI